MPPPRDPSAPDEPPIVKAPREAPETKSLTEQTVAGLSWQFLGTGAELIIRISVMVILARLLAPEEFGVAAAASVVISFSQIFAQLGVGQAIVQRKTLSQAHLKAGFAFSLWSGAIIALAIFAASPLIASAFKMPSMRWPVAALSLVFLFTGPAIVAIALNQRERRYKRIAAIDSITFTLAYLVVAVLLAYLGAGLWSLVIAQLVQTIARSAAFLVIQRHAKQLWPPLAPLKDLLGSGFGYSLGAIGNFLATNGDNFAVGRLLGASALGIYGRAYQFLMVPTNLFGAVVDKVLFPAMAHVQGDPERLSRAFRRSLAAVALVTLPVSGVLCVLAPELVLVTLGEKWGQVVVPFQVLAVTMLFRTSYKMSDSLARATGNVYRRAWRQWTYAAAVTVGASIGAIGGIPGVAVGVGLAIVLNFFLMLQLSVAITDVSWRVITIVHLRCLSAAAPVVAMCAAATWWMRGHSANAFLTIAVAGAAAAAAFGLVLHWRRQFYGPDGEWIVDLAKTMLLKRLKRR